LARAPTGGKSTWSEVSAAPFQDGLYVRLLNRGRGGYLFSDETGRGVSIDHRRGMVNTAWVVQILETINRSCVTSMMEWEVEVIPLRVERPAYQLRPGAQIL
jgi:hypothetical protein